MDCFEQIIGLAPDSSECLKTALTSENKTSKSGLFVSQMEETSSLLKVLNGISDAERNVNTFFTTALKSAIAAFKEKLFIEIGSRYTVKQNPFIGLIGQVSSTAVLNLSSDFAGAAYEMRYLKGGTMKVTHLHISINMTTLVTVHVFKAYVVGGEYQVQGAALATVEVNAVAGASTTHQLAAPLELPLSDETGNQIYYLFLMDRSTGFQPLNTKATCGCNGQRDVENWLTQYGVEGNDYQHILTSSRNSAYVNGVVISAEIKCNDTGFVCDSYNGNPYIKTAIEHAILYQTASNLITAILRSDVVNRYTLTKREQGATDAAILHNKFKSRVPWIAENIDMKHNNCFVCNTINEAHYGPYKTSIRL